MFQSSLRPARAPLGGAGLLLLLAGGASPARAQAPTIEPPPRLGLAPASGAAAARREALVQARNALRFVTTAQESFFARQSTYTQDVAALREVLRRSWGDSVEVRIHFAGPRGWMATATHPAAPGRSCVSFVGDRAALPELPRTLADGKPPAEEGVPACDEP